MRGLLELYDSSANRSNTDLLPYLDFCKSDLEALLAKFSLLYASLCRANQEEELGMRMRSLWMGFSCLFLSVAGFAEVKKYSAEQFLNTKRYAGGAFDFSEKNILFSSDESGVFNIYSVPAVGGNQTQLTHSTDRALMLVSGFPADGRLLYASDDLGNELHHIFLRNVDGTVRDLTPWPHARAEFYGWSQDEKSFFFLSNQRKSECMDLYEMDIESLQPRFLYSNEGGFNLFGISPNRRYLALNKLVSANHSEIYIYDLSAKTLQNVTPHSTEIRSIPLRFSADSRSLYYLTDEGSEFDYLKRLDMGSGKTEVLERHPWDIFFCQFSHTDKYRVTGINEDARTVLQVYDQQAGKKVPLSQLPLGEITQVRISKSEKSMLFYVNGDCSPNNLYCYNFETSSCCRLTQSLSSGIDPADLVVSEVVRYPSYDGTLIPALYYKPKDIRKEMPALVWVHGGPGGQSRTGYSFLIQYLVNQGYPVLSVNNRGSSGYGKSFFKAADHRHGEADLDDCIWAKHFLIGTGEIDPNKIGIIGGSYGGYIVLAALAFRPNEMALGVDLCGVSNWVRTLKSIPPWWETQRTALYKKIGNPETETEYLESISPLFHAENIRNPLLVIQGANDPRVLKVESDQIIEAVSKAGVSHQYLVFDDEGHAFVKKQNQVRTLTSIVEFLDQHLKGLEK